MIKAIIFDCFGVILTDALQVLRSDVAQRRPEVAQRIDDIVRANNRGMLEPSESNQMIAELLDMSVEELRGKVDAREVRDEKLLAYIQTLRAEYKIGLLSNIGVSSLEKRFSQTELDQYFDAVIVSGEVGYAKPEPEIYEIAADRLGVRLDECLFTDDRPEYCEAARAIGMRAIPYESFVQFEQALQSLLKK